MKASGGRALRFVATGAACVGCVVVWHSFSFGAANFADTLGWPGGLMMFGSFGLLGAALGALGSYGVRLHEMTVGRRLAWSMAFGLPCGVASLIAVYRRLPSSLASLGAHTGEILLRAAVFTALMMAGVALYGWLARRRREQEDRDRRKRRTIIALFLTAVLTAAVAVPPAMGNRSYSRGQYDDALYWFRISHRVVPCQWTTEAVSHTLWLLNRDAEAAPPLVALLTRGARLTLYSYFILAEHFLRQADAHWLKRIADEVEKHYPGCQIGHISRGALAEVERDLAKAVWEYEAAWKMVSEWDDDPYTLWWLSLHLTTVHMGMGKYEQAWEDAAKGLKVAPDDPTLLFLAGVSAEGMQEYEQAEEQFRRGLEVSHYPQAYLYPICQLAGRTGRLEEARAILLKHRPEITAAQYRSCEGALASYADAPKVVADLRGVAGGIQHPEGGMWMRILALGAETWEGPNPIAARELERMEIDDEAWPHEVYRRIYLCQARGRVGDEDRAFLGKMYKRMAFSALNYQALDVRDVLNGRRVRLPRVRHYAPPGEQRGQPRPERQRVV